MSFKSYTALPGLCRLAALLFAAACAPAQAGQGCGPVSGLEARRVSGDSMLLSWDAGVCDGPGVSYVLSVAEDEAGPWRAVAEYRSASAYAKALRLPFWVVRKDSGAHGALVPLKLFSESAPRKFAAVSRIESGRAAAQAVCRLRGRPLWFNPARLNSFILLLVFVAVFAWAVFHARRGGLQVRRLPAMDAMEKAVRKSAACGKPVLYVTGVGTASAMPTIASMSILGEVAAKCAACGARLIVPHYDPVVLGICKEVVRKGYERAGRAADYNDGINFFVSQDQFSFVAAVDGLISREKPGACFYMGQFMAESLLLTEVGAASGAVQVAGTDAESQLSFFHASCDHTLVGEEFYAAGACLSGDPVLLGSLRAQDLIKALAVALVACAIGAAVFAEFYGGSGLADAAMELLQAF